MASGNRITHATGGNLSRVDLKASQIGIVKQVSDSESMGRLKVWIKGSNSPETDPSGWITCNYASPFAGATDPSLLGNALESYYETQKSYGFWTSPPDVGNEVIVMFINGDIRKAFWVACLYQKDMNAMVPGISEGLSYQSGQFGNLPLPVAEYNKLGNSANQRPFYQPLTDGLATQGLLGDGLRGAGSSSARRESPSRVSGWLTPGGNQFIMDDGENSELIRIRTKSGAQILVSETDGHIYAISRDGKSWFELGNDGNVDIYGLGSISVNSGGDINLRAENDVNIEAGNNLNVYSKKDIKIQSGEGSINANAAKDLSLYTSEQFNLFSGGNHTIRSNGDFNETIMGDKYLYHDANKTISTDAFSHPAGNPNPLVTTGDLQQPSSALTPTLNQQILHGDTTQDTPISSPCSRVPDHEPWAGHAAPVRGIRNQVQQEEGSSSVSRGSVSTQAAKPLPVVGSPTAGMEPGVYLPKGYDSKGEPVYTYSGETTALVATNTLITSDEGVKFIMTQEGWSAKKYPDASGFSIGYGHFIIPSDPPEVQSGPISRETGEMLLKNDLKKSENAIRKYITVPLTQSQFDALVSFTYNCGVGALQKSTLRKKLNEGNYADVPSELMKWVKSGGKTLPVLVKRRTAEGLIFARPVSGS